MFKTTCSTSGMRHWLKRHNFAYKKPAVVPGKANKEQQQAWLAEYEHLRQPLPANETICFIDGIHPTHNLQQEETASKQENVEKASPQFIKFHCKKSKQKRVYSALNFNR